MQHITAKDLFIQTWMDDSGCKGLLCKYMWMWLTEVDTFDCPGSFEDCTVTAKTPGKTGRLLNQASL